MKTWKETLTDAIRKLGRVALCDHSLYGQLSGCHTFAAWATGKPEVYLPMAVLYAVMAWKGH